MKEISKDEDLTLASRIKKVRRDKKLTQEEFGNILGVSRNAITNIEIERVEPSPLFINHLCDKFIINRNWLETGLGDQYNDTLHERNNNLAEIIANITHDPNHKLRSIIEVAYELDDEYLELLEKVAIGFKK